MRKKNFIFGIVILSATIAVVSARADHVTVKFIGHVTYAEDFYCQCLIDVEIGSELTGYYIYDLDIIDHDPDTHIGLYPDSFPPTSITISVGSHEWISDPTNPDFSITLNDSVVDQWGVHDGYVVRESNATDTLFYLYPDYILLRLRDNTATVLSSDSLPASSPDLSDWNGERLVRVRGDFDVRAVIDTMWTDNVTGLDVLDTKDKQKLLLLSNFPNPFSTGSFIRFRTESTEKVEIAIFDVRGRLVYHDGPLSVTPGVNEYYIFGRTSNHNNLPTGTYFFRISQAGISTTSKFVIVR